MKSAWFTELDRNTRNGYDPEYVAKEIIKGLCSEEEELFIARYTSYSIWNILLVYNCRNIFEMNSINNHFHFRYHHVAFIYLRRLLPTISMRVLEARTIQGFLPKVNYIFEQLLAPSGLYTSPYLNENKNKWHNVL